MDFWTALTIGGLGSFHCIGMCGPIALALPVPTQDKSGRFLAGLIYNSGRIITYALIGALFGLIGQGFALAGLQQVLSITLGSVIIITVLFPVLQQKMFPANQFIGKRVSFLKKGMQKLFAQKTFFSFFTIGLLNGLLPCGLVYLGVAGATASGDVVHGALYMVVFGLGTFPVMLSLSWAGSRISLNFRNKIRQALPYMVAFIGVLFIIRGLNLGIPYISPEINSGTGMTECH